VRRALELNRSDIVNEGHIARALDPWDPNCEFTSIMSAVEPETYRGHHALWRYLEELSDSWDEWRMEVEDVSDVGSNTVTSFMASANLELVRSIYVEAPVGASSKPSWRITVAVS
jgi:ketosteroid isomerase-like protein